MTESVAGSSRPSTDSNSPGPIQILKLNESTKKFELDVKILESLLQSSNVSNCSIAVIAITGAFRKGKSFILNLFLRYLKEVYDNHNELDWMGDDSAILEGFEWRGGSKRHTTGIWIWSKIFTTTRANGERIGVMLMDTQGISSKESTVNEDMTILSFSTMVSSVQIYNLFNNIQEDDLQNLQLFTEYAKCSMPTQSFQKLLLLIRDWNYPYDADYGYDGGKKIIDSKFEINQDQSDELRKVREHLLSCYDEISCCLLPSLGDLATTSQGFKGQLKDIHEEFIEICKIMIPALLHPEKVLIKRIDDRELKAHNICAYIESFWKALMAGGIKTVQSISATSGETNIRTAVMAAITFYDDEMSKNTESDVPYKNTDQMRSMNSDIYYQAIEIFDNAAVLGDEQLKSSFRTKLKADLEGKFQLYLAQNEGKKVKDLSAQRELLLSQLDSFKNTGTKQLETIQSLNIQAKMQSMARVEDKMSLHHDQSRAQQIQTSKECNPIIRPAREMSVRNKVEPLSVATVQCDSGIPFNRGNVPVNQLHKFSETKRSSVSVLPLPMSNVPSVQSFSMRETEIDAHEKNKYEQQATNAKAHLDLQHDKEKAAMKNQFDIESRKIEEDKRRLKAQQDEIKERMSRMEYEEREKIKREKIMTNKNTIKENDKEIRRLRNEIKINKQKLEKNNKNKVMNFITKQIKPEQAIEAKENKYLSRIECYTKKIEDLIYENSVFSDEYEALEKLSKLRPSEESDFEIIDM